MGILDVGLLSGSDVAPAERPAAMDRLEKSLVELCRYAAKSGVNIVLEVFDRDIDKKCLIGKSDLAVTVAQKIRMKYPNFGLILDLSHIPLQYEPTKTAIKNCARYSTHLHIGNCVLKDRNHPVYGDQHPRFGVNGGENDVDQLREFFETLFEEGVLKKDTAVKVGEKPLISFEVKPMAGENPCLVIANSKRVFKQAWALL
jgi:sugar phosphate isomerase/epimerase